MNKVELLAPAKDLEIGKLAINVGADAVYIGASHFGAREKASNPLEDIAELTEYAHKFNCKVYSTVNTLLYTKEINQAQKLMCDLDKANVDGIIIQDTGLLEIDIPSIPIIASTQMNIDSIEKINFYNKLGVNRFILPREMSLSDIKKIRSEISSDIELESFIHGALCVGRSGQCYLSYAIGGRSGNRGCCAQPCRKKYTLKDENGNILIKNKHLLSLKDLSLSNKIEKMIDAGINSFKIEGRLKDKNYVVNTVAFYREKIDSILKNKGLEKSSTGISICKGDFSPDINKTFNRDFTEYFIDGIPKEKLSSIDTPTMKGEFVGKVQEVKGSKIVFDREISLSNGDGICFFNNFDILKGTNVNKIIDNNSIIINEEKGILENTLVYRNFSINWNRNLERSKIKRFVEVGIKVNNTEKGLKFTIEDKNEIRESITYDENIEIAQNKEKAIENIKKQLNKLVDDSHFICNDVIIELKEIPFLSISTLNSIRRELHKKLEERRKSLYKTKKTERNRLITAIYPENELDYKGNILNSYAERFYKKHGVYKLSLCPESGIDVNKKEVMRCKYCIRRELSMCHGDKSKNTSLKMYNEESNLMLTFDCKYCVMRVIYCRS